MDHNAAAKNSSPAQHPPALACFRKIQRIPHFRTWIRTARKGGIRECPCERLVSTCIAYSTCIGRLFQRVVSTFDADQVWNDCMPDPANGERRRTKAARSMDPLSVEWRAHRVPSTYSATGRTHGNAADVVLARLSHSTWRREPQSLAHTCFLQGERKVENLAFSQHRAVTQRHHVVQICSCSNEPFADRLVFACPTRSHTCMA